MIKMNTGCARTSLCPEPTPEPEPEPVEITELVSLDGRFRVQFDEPGWIDTTTGDTAEGTGFHPEILEAKRTALMGVSISGEDWEWGEVTPESVMDQALKHGTPQGFIAGSAPRITIAGNLAHGISLDTGFNYMYFYHLPAEDGVSDAVLITGADKPDADHVLELLDGKINRVG